MPRRTISLVSGKVYHVFTRSIAKFKVFRYPEEYERIIDAISFYSLRNSSISFSHFLERKSQDSIKQNLLISQGKLVKIIAFCIMPTHVHLILQQIDDDGISIFMGRVLNSYSKYFNIRTSRKGPVWEGRFQSVEVKTDEQLLHLTRYLHLNPSTSYLSEKPEDWAFSSYSEFLGRRDKSSAITEFSHLLNISPNKYKKFVESNIDYQRELKHIKSILLD